MFFRYVSSSLGFLPTVSDIVSTITGRSLSNVDPEVQIILDQILRSVINETEIAKSHHNTTNETEANETREKRSAQYINPLLTVRTNIFKKEKYGAAGAHKLS